MHFRAGHGGGSKAYPYEKAEENRQENVEKLTRTVRDDGAWIDAGENDNLMASKLVQSDAVGVSVTASSTRTPTKSKVP